MRSLLLVLALLSAACGSKKAPAPKACQSNEDCPGNQVCLAEKCADPGSAATPGKVKAEVEEKGAQHEQQIDKAVEEAEGK